MQCTEKCGRITTVEFFSSVVGKTNSLKLNNSPTSSSLTTTTTFATFSPHRPPAPLICFLRAPTDCLKSPLALFAFILSKSRKILLSVLNLHLSHFPFFFLFPPFLLFDLHFQRHHYSAVCFLWRTIRRPYAAVDFTTATAVRRRRGGRTSESFPFVSSSLSRFVCVLLGSVRV